MRKKEKFSCFSHLGGFIAALIGMIFLIVVTYNNTGNLVVGIIYSISVSFLFLSSTLYHAFKKQEKEKSIWRKLDHFANFVMIAGTYTPIAYTYLSGNFRIITIAIQWSLVFSGFFFKFFYLSAPRWLYTSIYLAMGWMAAFLMKLFLDTMPVSSIILMVSGGLAFTIGAVFYLVKKPKISYGFGFHEIFHIFILLGGFLHYLVVFKSLSI